MTGAEIRIRLEREGPFMNPILYVYVGDRLVHRIAQGDHSDVRLFQLLVGVCIDHG